MCGIVKPVHRRLPNNYARLNSIQRMPFTLKQHHIHVLLSSPSPADGSLQRVVIANSVRRRHSDVGTTDVQEDVGLDGVDEGDWGGF